MKIDSATIGMESVRNYKKQHTTVRRFTIMDYHQGLTQENDSLNAAIGNESQDTSKSEEKTEEKNTTNNAFTTLQEWQIRLQSGVSTVTVRNSADQTYLDIRHATIRYIFDLLFAARRGQLKSWLKDHALQEQRESYYEEVEETSFRTEGMVRTSDGREITFQVNVGMSRSFQEYYGEATEMAAFSMCDPLVINLDTDVAALQDQTFYFDIDADGEEDEIANLGQGSGYLALDRNNDGKINDGSELFGTASGDGFSDLAIYDEDGNGWIDENDKIWDKLKIWTKDENGKDILYRLADKGVGAICLKNVETDFTQKSSQGKTLGAVRKSGIFLYENGNVGTVQHIDVARYEKDA